MELGRRSATTSAGATLSARRFARAATARPISRYVSATPKWRSATLSGAVATAWSNAAHSVAGARFWGLLSVQVSKRILDLRIVNFRWVGHL